MQDLTLKYIESESGLSLIDFKPETEGYCIAIEFGIGSKQKNGSEAFSCLVCDEKGLYQLMWKDPEYKSKKITSLSNYHVILMNPYHYENLLQYIQNRINQIPKDLHWKQQGLLLSKTFYWDQLDALIDNYKA